MASKFPAVDNVRDSLAEHLYEVRGGACFYRPIAVLHELAVEICSSNSSRPPLVVLRELATLSRRSGLADTLGRAYPVGERSGIVCLDEIEAAKEPLVRPDRSGRQNPALHIAIANPYAVSASATLGIPQMDEAGTVSPLLYSG
jgi:hypothetical protein